MVSKTGLGASGFGDEEEGEPVKNGVERRMVQDQENQLVKQTDSARTAVGCSYGSPTRVISRESMPVILGNLPTEEHARHFRTHQKFVRSYY